MLIFFFPLALLMRSPISNPGDFCPFAHTHTSRTQHTPTHPLIPPILLTRQLTRLPVVDYASVLHTFAPSPQQNGCNLNDLSRATSPGWSHARIRPYVRWHRAPLSTCTTYRQSSVRIRAMSLITFQFLYLPWKLTVAVECQYPNLIFDWTLRLFWHW